ncbi:MAG TPA: efflux RND transporter periplasmic adaptor subunit [Longimicrobiales bacterium]|nr:efflux RND transporter periplasmic adaptor subunit [Longimicrobiales bacterium]
MKRRGRIILAGVGGAVLVLAGGTAVVRGGDTSDEGPRTVRVGRGTVEARALAVGAIEPEVEVTVKSKVSGVVQREFAGEGDYVEAGAALLEIRPDPTPLELVEARRALELREIAVGNLRTERDRVRSLVSSDLAPRQQLDTAERSYQEALLELTTARERLELLESGRVTSEAGTVESVVRSPIAGYVLEKTVEVGDPVVPLSTYQEGTVLMTMADMDRLVFRGTVDEIDVGRLAEGMPVSISVGALPGHTVQGTLTRISLKAQTVESATVFPVEVMVETPAELRLRAGFSANAEILMDARSDVLLVPERVVHFEGDSAYVEVPGRDGARERRAIRTGLSDAIKVEVVQGLEEGEAVLEKPVRTVADG